MQLILIFILQINFYTSQYDAVKNKTTISQRTSNLSQPWPLFVNITECKIRTISVKYARFWKRPRMEIHRIHVCIEWPTTASKTIHFYYVIIRAVILFVLQPNDIRVLEKLFIAYDYIWYIFHRVKIEWGNYFGRITNLKTRKASHWKTEEDLTHTTKRLEWLIYF